MLVDDAGWHVARRLAIPPNVVPHRLPPCTPELQPAEPLSNVVSMRGTPEWREWLSRLSERCRATPSGLIDRALAELARREGFEDPPPLT